MLDALIELEALLQERPDVHVHGFRSGGGLRVLSCQNADGSKLGYGEGPTLPEALKILVDDIKAGGRPYAEVYGNLYPHYLTGQSSPSDDLDFRLLNGSSLDMGWTRDFWVKINGIEDERWPSELLERARQGEVIEWSTLRRVTLRIRPSTFPNGEVGSSIEVVSLPPGMSHHRAWTWYATWEGRGSSLETAIATALQARPIERNE